MRANEYRVLERAVEEGLQYAITRAFKYESKPRLSEEKLREKVEDMTQNIMGTICEWFEFPDYPYHTSTEERLVVDAEDV